MIINQVDPSGLKSNKICALDENGNPTNICVGLLSFDDDPFDRGGGSFGGFGGLNYIPGVGFVIPGGSGFSADIGGFDSGGCFLEGECGGLPSGLSIPPPTLGDLLGIPQANPQCDFGTCAPAGNSLSPQLDNIPTPRLDSIGNCADDALGELGKAGKVISFFSVFGYVPTFSGDAIRNIRETGKFGTAKYLALLAAEKAAPVYGALVKLGAEGAVTALTLGATVTHGVILGGCAIGTVRNLPNTIGSQLPPY